MDMIRDDHVWINYELLNLELLIAEDDDAGDALDEAHIVNKRDCWVGLLACVEIPHEETGEIVVVLSAQGIGEHSSLTSPRK